MPQVINITDLGKIDWTPIQEEFDAITHVDKIFYRLNELVNDLGICTDIKCEAFSELSALGRSRKKFKPEQKSPEMAAKSPEFITNKVLLQKWTREYETYRAEADNVMRRIFALKVTRDKADAEAIIEHDRLMEIIREFVKGKVMPADFTKTLQNRLNKYGKSIDYEDPDLLKISEQMQAQIKDTRKKEKEKESG